MNKGKNLKISKSLIGNKRALGSRRTNESRNKISKNHAKYWLGKKRETTSIKTRRKISEALMGEKAPGWKGGISSINTIIRSSLEYRLWRRSVFIRDNYTCVWCGIKSKKGIQVILHADHIKPFALFPELRFATDNGRTLCIKCHKTTNTYAGKTRETII